MVGRDRPGNERPGSSPATGGPAAITAAASRGRSGAADLAAVLAIFPFVKSVSSVAWSASPVSSAPASGRVKYAPSDARSCMIGLFAGGGEILRLAARVASWEVHDPRPGRARALCRENGVGFASGSMGLTNAERQRCWRERRNASVPPPRTPPRPRRWAAALAELRTLQAEYEAWRDQLPESLADSRTRRAHRGRLRRRPRRPPTSSSRGGSGRD